MGSGKDINAVLDEHIRRFLRLASQLRQLPASVRAQLSFRAAGTGNNSQKRPDLCSRCGLPLGPADTSQLELVKKKRRRRKARKKKRKIGGKGEQRENMDGNVEKAQENVNDGLTPTNKNVQMNTTKMKTKKKNRFNYTSLTYSVNIFQPQGNGTIDTKCHRKFLYLIFKILNYLQFAIQGPYTVGAFLV